MHVAFVSMHTVHGLETGATRRTRQTARLLAARGHEVTVLCSRWWGGDLPTFDHEGITYRAVTDVPATGSFAAKLPLVLRSVGADVIQAVNSPPAHVRTAKAAARLLRVPVVVDWWADQPGDSDAAYRRAVAAADEIFAPSRMVRTRVREHGARADAVRVVPDPVDMDLVRGAGVDERADVLYARDLDGDSNVETFLLALAELRDRDWRAVVVGDGPNRADAERMARDLRIDDRVAFLGDLPPAEFVPIMKGAHVFAQTATREPFATGLLWALACGCVGIVEYQVDSSAHELVENCDRGVRVTSPQELADEIVAAAGMERLAVNDAFAEYDEDEVVDRYLDRYRAVIDRQGLF